SLDDAPRALVLCPARRLLGSAGQREQGTCVSHRNPSARNFGTDFLRKPEQPQCVRHRRSILADGRRDGVLRKLEVLRQPSVSERFVDWIQVLTLKILDERHLEKRSL